MNQVLALALITAFAAYGWPAFPGARRPLLFLLVAFFPIVGWIVVAILGYRARAAADLAARRLRWELSVQERDADRRFWEDRMRHGTPVEKLIGHDLITAWESADPRNTFGPTVRPSEFVPVDQALQALLTHDLGDAQALAIPGVDLVRPLPSGRVLNREERNRARFNGVLYIPLALTARP